MCFATVTLTVAKLRAVTMHHNKDTQKEIKEIIVIEAAVWMFWAFVFGFGYMLANVMFQFNKKHMAMSNLLKSRMQILNKWPARYEQLRVNAENENQAMCCGVFNPRFLAMIKSIVTK